MDLLVVLFSFYYINNAIMNFFVHAPLCTYVIISLIQYPRSRIPNLNFPNLNFERYHKIAFQSHFTTLQSNQQYISRLLPDYQVLS